MCRDSWFLRLCFQEIFYFCARFGSTYTKIGTIQRRLAWPLRKDDMQIREAFHTFSIDNKNKNKQMGPNQTSKFLHRKGKPKQHKKITHRMGENLCM